MSNTAYNIPFQTRFIWTRLCTIRFGHIPVLLVRASSDKRDPDVSLRLSRSVSHPPVSCLASVVVSIPIFELIQLVRHLAGFGAACLTSDETLERFSGITTHSQSVAPSTIVIPTTCVQFVPNLKKASSGRSPLDSICKSPFVSFPLSQA